MSSSLIYALVSSAIISIFLGTYYYGTAVKQLPLPPGPRGSIIYGVKHLLPSVEPWKKYAEWATHFGESIISFRVYNRRIIVLSDIDAVHELLERRANIYSDRPKSWMFHEICDRGKAAFNISSQDPRHRRYRKLLNSGLSARATQTYWPLMQSEVATLLDGLSTCPEQFVKHCRRNAAGVVMKMAFGYTVTRDDLFIQVAEEASKISGWATAPGRWLVDYYPIVRFIPSFFPGAGWKRQGEAWRRRLDTLSGVPHAWVKQQMASGNYIESFTSRHLLSDGVNMVDAEQEDIVKWVAGGLYAGAADTTVSAVMSFVSLMALYPEVQKEVQAELDNLIGPGRLPDPPELSRLNYLTAVWKEVLRYAPVANLALPHKVTEDDTYKGYRIPKGTTIVANTWALMHDPAIYPEPFTFSPSRFIPTSNPKSKCPPEQPRIQPDPRSFAFGFGRRSCPGIHFAETTMMLTASSILAKFDISLPHGTPRPIVEFTTGITSHIKPFDLQITPRSLNHES